MNWVTQDTRESWQNLKWSQFEIFMNHEYMNKAGSENVQWGGGGGDKKIVLMKNNKKKGGFLKKIPPNCGPGLFFF